MQRCVVAITVAVDDVGVVECGYVVGVVVIVVIWSCVGAGFVYVIAVDGRCFAIVTHTVVVIVRCVAVVCVIIVMYDVVDVGAGVVVFCRC